LIIKKKDKGTNKIELKILLIKSEFIK